MSRHGADLDRGYFSLRRRLGVMGQVFRLEMNHSPVTAIGAIVLVLLASAGTPILGLAQRWLVDAVLGGESSGVVAAVVLGVICHMVGIMVWRLHLIMRHTTQERVGLELSTELLDLTSRIPTLDHVERSDYLNRLTTVINGIPSLVTAFWSVVKTTATGLGLAGSVILLATVHPALIGLTVLALPPLWFAGRAQRLVAKARIASAESLRHEQHLHDLCTDTATAKEVMTAGSGAEIRSLALADWEESNRLQRRATLAAGGVQAIGWVFFVAGLIAALAWVSILVLDGRATVGDMALVISIAVTLQGQVGMTMIAAGNVTDAGDISAHYLWFRDYAQEQISTGAAAPHRLSTGIRLDGVAYHYAEADRPALAHLDLELPAGSVVGVVGVNGAGKTTLVKLLTGMHHPTAGTITVDGIRLDDLDPAGWAKRCSGTFQDFSRFEFLARETVGVGELASIDDRTAVEAAMTHAGAHSVVNALDQGLDTQLGRTFAGTDLSGGQWQKLALSRGLMAEAPLLFVLDEPTAALDAQAEQELFEAFTDHARRQASQYGTVTILVSHRFSTLHMADRIIVLDGGRVVEQGNHVELMRSGGAYAQLYRQQASAYGDIRPD